MGNISDNADVIVPKPVESVYRKKKPPGNMEEEVVQFLFHLISPAVYDTHGFETDKAYFRSIAEKEYTLPDNTRRKFSVSTLARYVRLYRTEGIDGLKRKQRADKGISRKLTPEAENRIGEIIARVSTATSTSVLDRLIKENVMQKGECSVDTVRRYIDTNELRTIPQDVTASRNSFLVPHAGDLYVADTVYYEKLGNPVEGKKVPWLYVQGIVDDFSRLLLVTECYTKDDALNFQMTLRKSISLFGLPERLYVDNGSPYNNKDLTIICNRLGIDLIHAPPYNGASKGVVENKWKLLLNETRVDIVIDNLTTQEELDSRVQEWRTTYNSRINTGVNGIPIERFKASIAEKPMRRIPSQEELSKAFSHERTRVLDNLGIIHLEGVKFKAPESLREKVKARTTVTVIYDPVDIEGTIHVLHNEKEYPLTVDDPLETGRENARKALERAREMKSCAGMTPEEIRAEERYRKRMAGTDRVKAESEGETSSDNQMVEPADTVEQKTCSVPWDEGISEERSSMQDTERNDLIASIFDEEAPSTVPLMY